MTTSTKVSDTPEADAMLAAFPDIFVFFRMVQRLERERNLALAIARKYLNVPELRDFPNIKP